MILACIDIYIDIGQFHGLLTKIYRPKRDYTVLTFQRRFMADHMHIVLPLEALALTRRCIMWLILLKARESRVN
jgi:hypothetical protein